MRQIIFKRQIISILLLCALFTPAICTVFTGQPNAHAENSIADYWKDDSSPSGRMNMILKTEYLYIKIAIFISFIILSYLLCFGLFRLSIQQSSGSPKKTFFWYFYSFLLMIYGVVFVCFHEYLFLTQAYDPTQTIMSQLRWFWIIVSVGVWGIVSLIITNWLRQ